MIRNRKYGLNCMFPSEPGSSQEAKFKNSKGGTCLKNIPKLSDVPALELAFSMSFSPFVLNPMSLALWIMLNQVPSGVIKCMCKDLVKFILHHKEDSCLLGNELWDKNFANYVTIELWYFRLKKHALFNKTKVMDGCSTIFNEEQQGTFLTFRNQKTLH